MLGPGHLLALLHALWYVDHPLLKSAVLESCTSWPWWCCSVWLENILQLQRLHHKKRAWRYGPSVYVVTKNAEPFGLILAVWIVLSRNDSWYCRLDRLYYGMVSLFAQHMMSDLQPYKALLCSAGTSVCISDIFARNHTNLRHDEQCSAGSYSAGGTATCSPVQTAPHVLVYI